MALHSKISWPLIFSESVTVPRRNVGKVGPRLCIAFIRHQRDACHCGESRQVLGLLVFSCALGWAILSDLLCAEPYRTRNTATFCCANPGPLLSKTWPRLEGVGSVRLPYNLCKNITWKLDIYDADGYYIKECYDNNKDKHVYRCRFMLLYFFIRLLTEGF